MNNDINFKTVLVVTLIVLIIAGFVYLPGIIRNRQLSIENSGSNDIKSSYGVNEYIPVYVDDEQMARKYLNDFIKISLNDISKSYLLLDEGYRKEKFNNSIKKYGEYLKYLNLSYGVTLKKYAVYDFLSYKVYDIYDSSGNRFIFVTNGVMQYSVYFDDKFIKGDD